MPKVQIELPPEIHRQVRVLAARGNQSIAKTVVEIVSDSVTSTLSQGSTLERTPTTEEAKAILSTARERPVRDFSKTSQAKKR